jgi:hypothetical protein
MLRVNLLNFVRFPSQAKVNEFFSSLEIYLKAPFKACEEISLFNSRSKEKLIERKQTAYVILSIISGSYVRR